MSFVRTVTTAAAISAQSVLLKEVDVGVSSTSDGTVCVEMSMNVIATSSELTQHTCKKYFQVTSHIYIAHTDLWFWLHELLVYVHN